VTGVFSSQAEAERAVKALRTTVVPSDKITLLTPGDIRRELDSVPVNSAEQPGMGKAIGAVLGAAGGMSTGALVAAVIPGVGLVTAIGILGTAILTAAGAGGAAAGDSLENRMTDGLPEDEIFLYEDALRKGRTVVIVFAEDETIATSVRERFTAEGAEAIDAARQQWWTGLRSAEQEHYAVSAGTNFDRDEKFYRLGFEAALHARMRCKEFDQVSAEMESKLEDVQREHPGEEVAEAFTRGYQRGREHYQHLCDESRAA
jgi:hypothetical protein